MRDRSEPSDQNELDLRLNEPAGQFAKILHSVFASRRATNRRIAGRRHWPASAPTVFLRGYRRARKDRCRPWLRRTPVLVPALRKRPPILHPWPYSASRSSQEGMSKVVAVKLGGKLNDWADTT